MNNVELQKQLDMQKWALSVEKEEDMCGKLPYCNYCKMSEEYPCAEAYIRMEEANRPVAPKKAKAPAKKATPKSTASKTTTKKAK